MIEDAEIIKRINGRYFPRLESLTLDYGIHWFNCDLSYLQSHPMLKNLSLNLRGSVDPWRLTDDNFPSLTSITFNADSVRLPTLPPHPIIAELFFPANIDLSELVRRRNHYPNLKICGYVGESAKLVSLDWQGRLINSVIYLCFTF